jgi:predicted nuclease of predicted toxin-antitoxin system
VKLLFDQNISSRIVRLIKDDFPDCSQVTLEGLTDSTDLEIWLWAKANNYCIVTFEADFLDLLTLKGFPPKVILLRTGNRRTTDLAEILKKRKSSIEAFFAENIVGCLEIISRDIH